MYNMNIYGNNSRIILPLYIEISLLSAHYTTTNYYKDTYIHTYNINIRSIIIYYLTEYVHMYIAVVPVSSPFTIALYCCQERTSTCT